MGRERWLAKAFVFRKSYSLCFLSVFICVHLWFLLPGLVLHVNFRNCAENVITSPVADDGYAEPPVNSAPLDPVV